MTTHNDTRRQPTTNKDSKTTTTTFHNLPNSLRASFTLPSGANSRKIRIVFFEYSVPKYLMNGRQQTTSSSSTTTTTTAAIAADKE